MNTRLPDSWYDDDSPSVGPFITFKYATLFDLLEREAYRRCGIKRMTLPSSLLYPDRHPVDLDLVDFREEITRRSTPGPMKDQAWRHIAEQVRTRDEHWLLWALFTAKPKLGSVGFDITAGRPALVCKIRHAALVVEFGAALHRLDLDRAFVFNRMIDTAETQATGRKRKPAPAPPMHESYDKLIGSTTKEPRSTRGLPGEDTEHEILQWLVEQINEGGHGRITDRQETLIRRTYLDREPLNEVARELGMSEPSASKMRKRGTDRLAVYLNRRDLIEPDQDGEAGKPDQDGEAGKPNQDGEAGKRAGDAGAAGTADQHDQPPPEDGEPYEEESEDAERAEEEADEYPW